MKPLAPNTLLQNRYLLVQIIGKGGMGEVYLAVDQRLGSAVALKRTFFSDDEVLGGAFEREARTLARMRHPVLPKVSDHFIENENQFLVMEHIAGEDLSKRLEASQKPFPLSWVLFWADQLLDALAYLHTHEPPILHRDIKPQNLKLTSDNNIILLDFGLSKNSLGETRISSAGSSGFTPHYAPMEQIRGTGTSPRSDIYSLSATLYQLLTNKVPPDSLSRADALLNGSPDPIEPVENINTEVTKVVSDVILKGISVSQEQRFATAREMQKELRDAYSKMQKAMAAQTIAFNARSEQIVPDAVDSQATTDPTSAPEIQTPVQSFIQTQAIPSIFDHEEISQGDTVPYNTPPPSVNQEQDFDKTIAYDLPPEAVPAKQSDVKTEVFSNAFFPSEVPVEEKVEADSPPEKFEPPVPVDARTDENILPETMFNAAKTEDEIDVPVVAAAPVESFSQTEDFSQPAEIPAQKQGNYSKELYPLPAVQTSPQPEKKSSGKGLMIAGGLVVLLFLALSAAGVGWYVYNGNSFAINPATPTPTPESTIEPTPVPTPQEVIAETNTNTNTEIETPANTNTQVNNQQEITKTETPGATPKPSVSPPVVKPTPKQTQLSTAGTPKATPKATPKKNDRIEILQ